MTAHSKALLVAGLALTLGLMPGLSAAATPDAKAASTSPLGKRITQWTLNDARGAKHSLHDLRDAKAVVVVFLGTECPLARMYAPRLAELSEELKGQGVQFVGVISNVQDSVADITKFVDDTGVKFPVLVDAKAELADEFGAKRTPEAFVLDHERIIRYQGRIDDQFGVGLKRPEIGRRDLTEAVSEVLAGKTVSQPTTALVGCLIGRPKQADATAEVTFNKHIAPLLNKRCVACHREGENAPFSVTSYDEVKGWADTIVEVVDAGRMPPWFASPEHGKFVDESRLSDAEKKLLRDWASAGCPQGDPKDAPKTPEFPQGWGMPLPDVVVPMSKTAYSVPATGVIPYQHFVADPGFTEDKWMVASEVRPGNRAVVHHVLVFLIRPGEDVTRRLLSGQLLSAYAPGNPPKLSRPGMAMKIPAGSKILFQMHYTTNGKAVDDISSLGMKFCDEKDVRQEVISGWAVNFSFKIPPNTDDYPVQSTFKFKEDRMLLQLTPHMHLRGKSFRYVAKYPDGTSEILLDVPKFDFNWQIDYHLAEPKLMPKGTVLHCSATFDNSSNNPSNPDPARTVTFGEQTWDEMMIGWLATASVPKSEEPAKPKDRQARKP